MTNNVLIILGKVFALVSKAVNLGHGSTWPGHIALFVNKNFIKNLIAKNKQLKIILIAGTNGKTTTAKLIRTVFEKNNKSIFQNESGANLINGVASSLLLNSNILGKIKKDYAIFEIDENTLPLILKELVPNYLILLNLFRDQLDRYGEVNTLAKKWTEALKKLNNKTTLILNADDPQIASLRQHPKGVNIKFFGLDDKKLATAKVQHAVDSTYCPRCGFKLYYSIIFYSHLGIWRCANCKNTRPKLDAGNSPIYPLIGIYNRYNTIAAVLLARQLNIAEKNINSALHTFEPAFGRQEMIRVNKKNIQLFLAKNPTSFNESLRTVANLKAKTVLFVLNDQIPDGRDVSWIWDTDTEEYIENFDLIIISGNRAFDMGLRIKYSLQNQFPINSKIQNFKFQIEESLKKAIALSFKKTAKSETLYILPTYSAMLEVRKILTDKKIL